MYFRKEQIQMACFVIGTALFSLKLIYYLSSSTLEHTH